VEKMSEEPKITLSDIVIAYHKADIRVIAFSTSTKKSEKGKDRYVEFKTPDSKLILRFNQEQWELLREMFIGDKEEEESE